MKKYHVLLTGVVLLSLLYLFVSTSIPFFPQKECMSDNACFLKTDWKQMGGFQKYTPDNMRLGCWSTAFAQIMYYHKLKPFGHIAYTSRKGFRINETIDSSKINWKLFANTINPATDNKTIDEMARYNYYAALAVQKDFGTDSYMNKLASASLLQEHYKVKVSRYISWRKVLPYTTGKLEKIIYEELNEKRPVFLHLANLKDFGHSVVIDGYCYQSDVFKVHLNQGQGGQGDGWYDFYNDILKKDDIALRVVYTFKPID
ncbi:MAG: hypothetical protein JWR12_790 [Mucilaginibacter sp.]|nr:hypothetical protein [Mucilaginibacter sp.]